MTLYKAVEQVEADGKGALRVFTRDCTMCGKTGRLDGVSPAGLAAWCGGTLIQDAFPDMPVPDRELLQSGIHPDCYRKFAGTPEPS